MDLEPGTVVDKYVVERQIGQGANGRVYRVRHRGLGGVHALKVPHPAERIGPGRAGDRLRTEARLQAELRHPHVVGVFDLLEVEGLPALVTELVDGPSLARILEEGPPSLPVLEDIARGVLKGVRAAHLHGLLHRDLKPADVLLATSPHPRSDDGVVPKVSDFGWPRSGPPRSPAPEQLADPEAPETVRSDVFALGVLLYELCAGCRPYPDGDPEALREILRTGRWVPLEDHVPSLPDRIGWTVGRAMALDPSERFGSVDEMLDSWLGATDATVWHPVFPAAAAFPATDPPTIPAARPAETETACATTEFALPRVVPPTDDSVTRPSSGRTPVPAEGPPYPSPRAGPVVRGSLIAAAAVGLLVGAGSVFAGGAALFGGGLLLWSRPDEDALARAPASLRIPSTPEVPRAVVAAPPAADPPKASAPPRTEPEPPTAAAVVLTGDAEALALIAADGRTFEPGAVPPGQYRLRVVFAGAEALRLDTVVSLDAGTTATIDCREAFFACTVR